MEDKKTEKKAFNKMLLFKIFILLGYILTFFALLFVVSRCSKDVSASSYIDVNYDFDNRYETDYAVSYMSLNDFENMGYDNFNSPNLVDVSQPFQNSILFHNALEFTYNYSFVFYAYNSQNAYQVRVSLLDNNQATLQTINVSGTFNNGWHNFSFDVDEEGVAYVSFAFVTPHTTCNRIALYYQSSLDHYIPYTAYVLYEAVFEVNQVRCYYMVYALYSNGHVLICSYNTDDNNDPFVILSFDSDLFSYARWYLIVTMHDYSIGSAILYCPKNKDFTLDNATLDVSNDNVTTERDYTFLQVMIYNSYYDWSNDNYRNSIANGGMTPFHKEIYVPDLTGFNNTKEMLFYYLNGFESQLNGTIKYHNEYLFGDLVSSFLNISFGNVQIGSTTFNFTLGLLLLFIIGIGALLVILKVMMGG